MAACTYRQKDVVKMFLAHQDVVDINIPEGVQLTEDLTKFIELQSMTLQKYK